VEDSGQAGVLRRKLRPAPVRRVRDAALDAWRRVVPRLALEGIGLELVVAGFQEREMDLHSELALEEGALLLYLAGPYGDPAGLAVVDAALLSGLVEVLTTGRVTSARREPRRATAVDAALARHVLDGWLEGVAEARGDGRWLPWATSRPTCARRSSSSRRGHGRKRGWNSTSRGASGRAGLRSTSSRAAGREMPAGGAGGLRPILMPVETDLEAVLARVRVPLGVVSALAPGQLIPLPGVSLRRITLEAPRGKVIAEVHLGQSGGFRAVRVVDPDSPAEPRGPVPGRAPARMMPMDMATDAADGDLLPPLPDLGMPGGGGLPPLPDIEMPGGGGLPPLPDAGMAGGLPPLHDI
jgi:flagellar motor switch protein FliM